MSRLQVARWIAPPGVLLALACSGGGGGHPLPSTAMPASEVFYGIGNNGPDRGFLRHSNGRTQVLNWEPAKVDDQGFSVSGETLQRLDDGRMLYCGIPWATQHHWGCWLINEATEDAEKIGPPVIDTEELFPRPQPAFGSDGSWWVLDQKAAPHTLRWSPDLTQDAAPVAFVGSPARLREAHFDAGTRRFTLHDDPCTEIGLYEHPSGVKVAAAPLKACAWSFVQRDGDLAWSQADGIWHWRPPAAPALVLPRGTQPDGREEQLHLGVFSPDGEKLLIESSRFNPSRENHCEGVSNPVYDTLVLDIGSGKLERVVLPEVQVWERSPP